jgi:hypothetical protein
VTCVSNGEHTAILRVEIETCSEINKGATTSSLEKCSNHRPATMPPKSPTAVLLYVVVVWSRECFVRVPAESPYLVILCIYCLFTSPFITRYLRDRMYLAGRSPCCRRRRTQKPARNERAENTLIKTAFDQRKKSPMYCLIESRARLFD